METIRKRKVSGVRYIGIVYAMNWYGTNDMRGTLIPNAADFVVGMWSDYHDGLHSHIEGKITIASCRLLEDAKLIYEKWYKNIRLSARTVTKTRGLHKNSLCSL